MEAIKLTPKAYLEIDERKAKRTSSEQGFVAMSFDHSLDTAFTNGFEPAIREAGYLGDRELRPLSWNIENPSEDDPSGDAYRGRPDMENDNE